MRYLFAFALLAFASYASAAINLSAFPPALAVRGADDAPQLTLTLRTDAGREKDVTVEAKYQVSDPSICRVDADGRIFPLANGKTEIKARLGSDTVVVPVTVSSMEAPLPLSFVNKVEPILTKLSCNSGGCHGKIQGQNGFRLSLLGFEPELDYMTLTKESRGRRMLPSAPEASLFLTKAAGQVPHGGGRKLDPNGEEYKILRRWIATGMPYGTSEDPVVTRVSVTPEARVLDRQSRQQLVVLAHYSDGSVEDVTRRAQYECSETELATVTDAGLVQTLSMTGQAAVMVRYSGVMTVFRAVLPRPGKSVDFAFENKTLVDQYTAQKWRDLNITPSTRSTDEQFLRRAYLDVTGTMPTPAEVVRFTTDTNPQKRELLIDRLLETPEYAFYFANKWADVLKIKRKNQPARASGTFAFHGWIHDAMAADMPFDRFVREILTAVGDDIKSPPTFWYKEVSTPEQFVDDFSQVFLGQRMACANCHHHPFERWSQDDYWGLAAFYGRVGRKQIQPAGTNNNNERKQLVYTRLNGSVTNKRTNRTAEIKALDADPMTVEPGVDPREKLADWISDPKNPFFAKAVANRYWAHFFGRGIVDPLDDMRVTNPPSNPELLDALAQDFIKNKYSLKSLIKTITKSNTYGLSSTPNEYNATDKQSYARYYPRRLPAEVVYDALCQVTDSHSPFPGLPNDKNAPQRAIMLPDESFGSYFLDVFGRPQRISACECERVNEASLAMILHLLNSQEVQDKIGRAGARAEKLATDPRPDEEKINELFLWAVAKKASPEQMVLAKAHLAKHSNSKKLGYENILWALVNTKGFLFNQ